MNRVLFITMHQLAGHSGGARASLAACRIVSETFAGRCRIVAPLESAQTIATIAHEDFVPVAARGLLTKIFYLALAHNADRFSPYVDKHMGQLLEGVSHVFLDGALIGRFAALFKRHYPQMHVTLLHHNFERAYYAELPMNRLTRLQHNRIIDHNQSAGWQHADLNLVFTHKDLADITACYGKPGVRAEVYGYYEPLAPRVEPTARKDALRLVITGNMSTIKGYEGVIWFLNRVWGAVSQRDHSLTIAGRDPVPALLQAATAHPNVQVITNPENMTQVLCDADIYLNPCSSGSGIKVRNLDGLRTGLPSLCRHGNEYGFEALPQDVFAVFEDEGDFITKLKGLDPDNRANVRAAYEKHFSLQSGVKRLNELLEL